MDDESIDNDDKLMNGSDEADTDDDNDNDDDDGEEDDGDDDEDNIPRGKIYIYVHQNFREQLKNPIKAIKKNSTSLATVESSEFLLK